LAKYGVEVTYVSGSDVSGYEVALQANTKLIYLESPNSLTFELQDIAAVASLAKKRGITVAIDNSYNSPLNQSPIALGADLVIHSATKYLNGHSDVVAGVVAGSRERIARMMAEEYMTLGAVVGAHDAWLMIRGMRTLELRVNRSAASALELAEFLRQHPKVEKVYYPWLTTNADFELAKQQMKQGGGLLSVLLKVEDVKQVEVFCDSLERFLLATSWGGHESLCFPMCALRASASFTNPLPWNLVRLYVGLEGVDVLRGDLEQALGRV
ncbi:MAG: trans-sulfuration enzyme family protein, partial [Bacteroidia bacterium]